MSVFSGVLCRPSLWMGGPSRERLDKPRYFPLYTVYGATTLPGWFWGLGAGSVTQVDTISHVFQ